MGTLPLFVAPSSARRPLVWFFLLDFDGIVTLSTHLLLVSCGRHVSVPGLPPTSLLLYSHLHTSQLASGLSEFVLNTCVQYEDDGVLSDELLPTLGNKTAIFYLGLGGIMRGAI